MIFFGYLLHDEAMSSTNLIMEEVNYFLARPNYRVGNSSGVETQTTSLVATRVLKVSFDRINWIVFKADYSRQSVVYSP